MITNLVEQGKRKCEQYWPETGSLMLGLIEVTMVQESVQAHCTVRTLRLRHTRLQRRAEAGAVREVTQHQYTSWPDHGTPTNIAPVLSFIKKSSAACQVRLIMIHVIMSSSIMSCSGVRGSTAGSLQRWCWQDWDLHRDRRDAEAAPGQGRDQHRLIPLPHQAPASIPSAD